MPGQVEHLERAVAEIDDVAVVEHARRRAALHCVRARVVAGSRQRLEQFLGELVARLRGTSRASRGVKSLRRSAPQIAPVGREIGNAGFVCEPLRELVQRTGVIEVVVGRERERRLFEEVARRFVQARDAEPGVDEQCPVAPAHEPDVAARERIDELLPELPDVVTDLLAYEPVSDCNLHVGSLMVRLHPVRRLSMYVRHPPWWVISMAESRAPAAARKPGTVEPSSSSIGPIASGAATPARKRPSSASPSA